MQEFPEPLCVIQEPVFYRSHGLNLLHIYRSRLFKFFHNGVQVYLRLPAELKNIRVITENDMVFVTRILGNYAFSESPYHLALIIADSPDIPDLNPAAQPSAVLIPVIRHELFVKVYFRVTLNKITASLFMSVLEITKENGCIVIAAGEQIKNVVSD